MLLTLALALAAQPTKRPSDEERGEELYRRHCVACHGPANDGRGPVSEALVATVPNLVGRVEPDDATADVVLRGKGAMPAYEATFNRADAIRVLRFMRQLSPSSPLPDEKPDKAGKKTSTKAKHP